MELDDKLELGGLLDRQVGQLGFASYFVSILGGSPVRAGRSLPRYGNQTTDLHVLAK